ncbi:MAG: VOC family protein [Gammaproteobacteria bacterium]|nr:VOC family protein [Gammaproteobacteria bacterium]
MDNARIWYVNVYVSDFNKSLEFYRDKMGLSVVVEDANFGYASFDTQGAGFAIAAVQPDSEQSSLVGRQTGIGWGVENVDDTYDSLRERGVEFTSPPQEQPWGGYMAMLQDPDGNVFYLDQLREEH